MPARPEPDPRFHLSVLAGVAVAYLMVRIAWQPTGFARYHLTDLLAGSALPSLLALVFRGHKPLASWSETLMGKLMLTVGATAVWEGLVPLLSNRSTPDFVDALSYVGGTLAQHAMVVLVRKHHAASARSSGETNAAR